MFSRILQHLVISSLDAALHMLLMALRLDTAAETSNWLFASRSDRVLQQDMHEEAPSMTIWSVVEMGAV